MDAIYTAIAHASGGGRDGHVRSEDDRIDLDTRPPKEMGGSGEGTNPEQLFAAGYSACFLGAVHGAGKQLSLPTKDAAVSASVGIGKDADGGFAITAELHVYVPGVSPEDSRRIADAAHTMCPYSKATRDNIAVSVIVVE